MIFQGLSFEYGVEIEQKGAFFKGLFAQFIDKQGRGVKNRRYAIYEIG